ncbi:MAG: hypothetical protein HY912_20335 [Desulfomonile tiedjei]|uniref:Uncharacterized protein n=1 Tax=Desulfomonile tiedjei TaxID=2358 RepID=A0A9D6Z267_9BACT|nr:hypothetical protein [Desulfomonile tiedjei]
MDKKFNSRRKSFAVLVSLLYLSFLGSGWAFSQVGECSAVRARWEGVFQELRLKLQEFQSIQQIHVEKIAQRPLIDRSENKSIARQVAEALQLKEDLLNAKRKECGNLLNLEAQTFNEFQDCAQGIKDKEFKNIVKKRQGIVDKTQISISEVQEVEGKDTIIPYNDAMQDQDPYARSVNNYWQNYQQMYKRWWGH